MTEKNILGRNVNKCPLVIYIHFTNKISLKSIYVCLSVYLTTQTSLILQKVDIQQVLFIVEKKKSRDLGQ